MQKTAANRFLITLVMRKSSVLLFAIGAFYALYVLRGRHLKHYSVTSITLWYIFALSHNALTLLRSFIASIAIGILVPLLLVLWGYVHPYSTYATIQLAQFVLSTFVSCDNLILLHFITYSIWYVQGLNIHQGKMGHFVAWLGRPLVTNGTSTLRNVHHTGHLPL